MILSIPYISQVDSGRPVNDCGPACALMVARAYGKATTITIDDLYALHGLPDEPLLVDRVVGILRDLGVPCRKVYGDMAALRGWLDERKPPILLVDLYGGHFVVATGYGPDLFYLHDPYKSGDAGENNVYTAMQVDAIWGPHGDQYAYTTIVPAEALGESMVDIVEIERILGELEGDIVAARDTLTSAGAYVDDIRVLLNEPDPPTPEPDLGEYEVYNTNGQSLFVRDAPGGTAIGRLYPGDVITVYEESAGWLRHSGGGWSHGDYLRPTSGGNEPAPYSKLGSHFNIRPGDYQAALPGRFHLINSDVGLLQFLLYNNPEAVAIFRHWPTEWGYAGKNAPVQGAATADQWWAETRGMLEQIPMDIRSRTFVKGVNEHKDPHLYADALNAFEMRRMDILGGQGFRAALFGFSPGVPDIVDGNDQWPLFYPALEQADREGALLALHEYWHYQPNEEWRLLPEADWPRTIDGRLAGWKMLRYRRIIDKHVRPNGWDNLRIGIGETGRGGNPAGWRNVMSAADYAAQLQLLDAYWREDPEVLGGAVFLHGLYSSGDQWAGFDISGEVARLMYDYVASLA